MNNSDIFLLVASFNEPYMSKALIKKLYSSLKNFSDEIFTMKAEDLCLIISREDYEKICLLRTEMQKLNLGEIKKSLAKKGIKFIAQCEDEYPKKLKAIEDPPFGLFYKGDLNALNGLKSVAIVGTRTASSYGMRISKEIASLLANNKITIVSGLASGIDTYAHLGAINNGKTVAVLGTGIDVVFPAENKELFNELLQKDNLIISEYPPGTRGYPWNFPQRNRIISALSDAVLVIEGDLQSGAMITARFAIKQSKPLFALPGPVDVPTSNGPNTLIKAGVAELLTSVNDILEKIGENKQVQLNLKNSNKTNLEGLNEKQKEVYKLLSHKARNFDILLQETKLDVQQLTRELSILELKGLVEKTIDGSYVQS